MKCLKFLLLSSIICCMQAELIDDLIEIILHDPKGMQLVKHAVEKDDQEEHVDSSPVETPRDPIEMKKPSESLGKQTDHNSHFQRYRYAHTGVRGGRKRVVYDGLKSLIEDVIVKEGDAALVQQASDTRKAIDVKRETEVAIDKELKSLLENIIAKNKKDALFQQFSDKVTTTKREKVKVKNNKFPDNLPWKRTQMKNKIDWPPNNLPWNPSDIQTKIKSDEPPSSLPWKRSKGKNKNDGAIDDLPSPPADAKVKTDKYTNLPLSTSDTKSKNDAPPDILPWKRAEAKNKNGAPPANVPWSSSDAKAKGEILRRERVYKRLLNDINEYFAMEKKTDVKKDTTPSLDDVLSKLIV